MYIQPTTNIRLLRNVPLDTTYEHTIYFTSATAQYNYFIGLQKYNLTNYSYQRVKRGYARVGIKADNLYDCNYMMFQNTAYGNKWFYAFITSVEFVNNECAEISFELDVMQTWHFNYEPDMCFIEREHVSDDSIGVHIEPEPVDLGEYVFNDYKTVYNCSTMAVIVAVVDVGGGSVVDGNLYDGVYGGCQLFAYDSTDVDGINNKLDDFIEAPDSVVSVYTIPKASLGTWGTSIPSDHKIPYGAKGVSFTFTTDAVTTDDYLDYYKPKNNKLYTYPYNFYHLDNSCGESLSLRYEFFINRTPNFTINSCITQPTTVTIRPRNYKNVIYNDSVSGDNTLNTESLSLTNFPMCSWNTDAYKAWTAQNNIPIALSALGQVPSIAMSSAANPAMGVASGISLASSIASQYYTASIQADILKGTIRSGNVNVASKKQNIYGGRCSVNKYNARMIDDFFTKFGYACRIMKKPNRNVRPHWCFTKTVNCTITGSVPADDMKKICSIYDNGVTFWKKGSEIGNYALDNSI